MELGFGVALLQAFAHSFFLWVCSWATDFFQDAPEHPSAQRRRRRLQVSDGQALDHSITTRRSQEMPRCGLGEATPA